jgi:hypothetical protein
MQKTCVKNVTILIINRTLQTKRIKQLYYEKVLKNLEEWKIKSRRAMRKMRARKYFSLSSEEYDKLATRCAVCGFDIVVELHHKAGDRKITISLT